MTRASPRDMISPPHSVPLERLAECCALALRDSAKAARRFLTVFDETHTALAERVLDARTLVQPAPLASFERESQAYLIRGRWGTFWLSPRLDVALAREAPVLTPRGLRALSEALYAHLLEDTG